MSSIRKDQQGRIIPLIHDHVMGNSSNPIVCVGNRKFFYDREKGMIRGRYPDLHNLGFISKHSYFERPICENLIASAYVVDSITAVINGYKAEAYSFDEDTKHLYVWFPEEAGGKAAGIKPYYDYGDRLMYSTPVYRGAVPVEMVTEMYEIRKPYKNFKFVGPEKVYHAKDGEWLQWHYLGTPLMDGEWY